MKTLKAVMPRSEELKKLLKAQYEAEYEDYQQMVEIEMQRQAQVAEEQRKWKLQQEGNKLKVKYLQIMAGIKIFPFFPFSQV